MIILLDNMSLNGQFESISDFTEYLRTVLLKFLSAVNETGDNLYKSMDMYERPVTPDNSLYSLITISGQPEITMLKSYLVQLFTEPFWENDSIYDSESEYYCDGVVQADANCYTEAIDRHGDIWSFLPVSAHIIEGRHEDNIWNMYHFSDYHSYLKISVHRDRKRLPYAIENHVFSKGIYIQESEEIRDFLGNVELNENDIDKLIDRIDIMVDDRLNGRNSHYWAPFMSDTDEYRLSISSGRELRIYYMWSNPIIFLYGYIKKKQTPPQHIKDHIENIARRYRGGSNKIG